MDEINYLHFVMLEFTNQLLSPNMHILAQADLNRLGVADWTLMSFISIAFAAVGYYLLQFGIARSKASAMFGIVFLVAAGLLVAVTQIPEFQLYVFFAFAGLAAGGGFTFLCARQPIYAALGFATAILSAAGVLFMNSALFVAAATMIVYAGATIIIFLFVLMFAQQSTLSTYDVKLNYPALAAIIGAVFLGTIVLSVQALPEEFRVVKADDSLRPLSQMVVIPGTLPNEKSTLVTTAGLGRSMFTEYLFTVEIAGTLLLAATIGSIAVAQRSLEVD